MRLIRFGILLALTVLTGCGSTAVAVDGSYEPSCTAFAGESISLRDGLYSWNKYTDARRIGPNGEVTDPYPDFPKTGAYGRDGTVIRLLDDNGVAMATWYLHEHQGRLALLNQDQQDAWSADGSYPDCMLVMAL